jgi:hypothetical protein
VILDAIPRAAGGRSMSAAAPVRVTGIDRDERSIRLARALGPTGDGAGRPGPPPSDGRRLTGAAGPRFQPVAAPWHAVVAARHERPRLAMIDAR